MTASLKTHAWELMALALFYFVFLGGEYFFDATLASFMSPADVVLNQGMILGASAVGFCCFEPFSRTPRRVRLGCSIVSMVVGFGGIAVLFAQPSLLLMQVIGVICFYLLGVLGGAVHWAASREIAGFDHAALLVGMPTPRESPCSSLPTRRSRIALQHRSLSPSAQLRSLWSAVDALRADAATVRPGSQVGRYQASGMCVTS